MAFFDLTENELKTYKPKRVEPDEFDEFWESTLSESNDQALDTVFEPVDYGLALIDVFDVSFSGYGGQKVKGWLLLPRERTEKLPCVVEYIGYGGGRGFPTDWLVWATAGYAHFVMDTRGQGSTWLHGDTADMEMPDANPHHPGFMTKGILNPETYYYRRVFTDAVRAIQAASSHESIDADQIALRGVSQGGGICIAAAGLAPSVKAIMTNVPFLCHYRRATEITDKLPYLEIANYLRVHRDKIDTVFDTLSYFDGVNFATRASAKALFSVGLMDEICPPSTVYAAYNHYAGEKDIKVWRYNFHDGGGSFQVKDEIFFLNSIMKR